MLYKITEQWEVGTPGIAADHLVMRDCCPTAKIYIILAKVSVSIILYHR